MLCFLLRIAAATEQAALNSLASGKCLSVKIAAEQDSKHSFLHHGLDFRDRRSRRKELLSSFQLQYM